ncbi:cell wall hydrolase [Qipengyuania soli]|nr:cell wall hydrolase [Qipengyuania soli]
MHDPRAIEVFQPQDDATPRRRFWLLLAAVFVPFSLSGQTTLHSGVRETDKVDVSARMPPRPDVAKLLRQSASKLATGAASDPLGIGSVGAIANLAASAAANPFYFAGSTTDLGRATECLAMAAWYEAGDNREDQRSVMQVVLNRVAHPAFPNSVCGVVFQGSQLSTGCQFTFTCDGSLQRRRPSAAALARARQAALAALEGSTYAPVAQATHYHADYVRPWWAGSMLQLAKVGRHIFYRLPGRGGVLPSRQGVAGGEQDFVYLVARSNKPGEAGTPGEVGEAAGPTIEYATSFAMGDAAPAAAPRVVSNAEFLQLDPGSANGRWAISAMARCQGKVNCQVLGYGDAGALEASRSRPSSQRERPLFLFLRDGSSGMDVALWDCQRVSRPDASQCLPASGPQLDRLMRER